MAAVKRIDPETLLRNHFVREIEEERKRSAPLDTHARTEAEPADAIPRNVPAIVSASRRPTWIQETAAAAVLAACVGAAYLTAPGEDSKPSPEVLGEKAVIVGRLIGTKLALAVSEFADIQGPAQQGSLIPGRFREKE